MEKLVTQEQRADFLIRWLLNEREEYENLEIPVSSAEKRRLLRSLMNVRPPIPASSEFLTVQDAYLQERLAERGVTRIGDLSPVRPGLYLWQGDITTLAADAMERYGDRPKTAGRLLPFLSGTGGRLRAAQRGLLLYFHR